MYKSDYYKYEDAEFVAFALAYCNTVIAMIIIFIEYIQLVVYKERKKNNEIQF